MSSGNSSHYSIASSTESDIVVVGLNHNTAPVEIRELLSWDSEQLPSLVANMQVSGIPGVAVSTCNRSEFFFLETEFADGVERLKGLLSSRFGLPADQINQYLYSHRNYEAVRHLFRVASGLDSMILGEEQIIGQVRQAYYAASITGTVPGLLARLFQQSSRAARRVRRESGIGANALSVSRACVELARSAVEDLSLSSILVIGAGEAGRTAAEALSIAGARNITVANRTHSRAQELASRLASKAVDFNQLPEALEQSDIVVSCTGSPGYVLEAPYIHRAMSVRPERPLFLVDIAVPRDIDPAVTQVRNVSLRDIDDLEALAECTREGRKQQVAVAEALVEEEASEFYRWWQGLNSLTPVIDLRQHADHMRRRELQRTFKRLGNKLSEEEKASLEAMTRALVNKLLHSPTMYLKELPASSGRQTANEIFGLYT